MNTISPKNDPPGERELTDSDRSVHYDEQTVCLNAKSRPAVIQDRPCDGRFYSELLT
jgi:hypothetical protein